MKKSLQMTTSSNFTLCWDGKICGFRAAGLSDLRGRLFLRFATLGGHVGVGPNSEARVLNGGGYDPFDRFVRANDFRKRNLRLRRRS
jgi:hypothetical protein